MKCKLCPVESNDKEGMKMHMKFVHNTWFSEELIK